MIQYQFEYDDVSGMWIQCTNCNKQFPFLLSETLTIEIIPVFIKSFFFRVSISWMVQKKEKYYCYPDLKFTCWFTLGLWYNTTI